MGCTVVCDATVVINLAVVERLELCAAIEGYAFVLPPVVVEEVTYPRERAALDAAIEKQALRVVAVTAPRVLALYAQLRQRLGRGESACLALAAEEGWMLASDDRDPAFRRAVVAKLGEGQLLLTTSVISLAIRGGCLSVADADAMIPR